MIREKGALLPRAAIAMVACLWGEGASAQEVVPAVREKLEVTGSNIKRLDSETGLPVTTITRADIERMGVLTAEELMQKVSAVGPGGHNMAEGLGDGSRSGLSAVSLHGLGSNNTLVLLNGRRLSNFAFNGIGGGTVNINQIPMAAIERVEVLKDGASAIYGTDAIGGVINFILRKDYQGAEVSAYGAWTEDGGGGTRKYSATVGYGDAGKDRFNVLAMFEYQKDEALAAAQRSFASTGIRPDLGISLVSTYTFPANFRYILPNGRLTSRLNVTAQRGCQPASGAYHVDFTGAPAPMNPNCLQDFTAVIDIYPPSERKGFFGRGVWQVAPDHQMFVEYRKSLTDTVFAVSETPVADFTGAGLIYYPAGGQYYPSSVTLSSGAVVHPTGDLRISWRAKQAGRRTDRVQTDESSWAAGMQGVLWGWDYDAVLSGASSNAKDTFLGGFLRESVLGPALQTGRIDIFSGAPLTAEAQALVDQALILGKIRESDAKVTAAGAKASREIAQAKYGPVALALGFDHRKDELEERPEEVLFSGDIVGGGGPIPTTTHASRTIKSLFAELTVPVVKQLEAQLAVRYDRFSDFGNTVNPKVALRWTPRPDILARASYGTGFRAPTLSDLFLPPAAGITERFDPARCVKTDDGPVPLGDFVSPLECEQLFNRIGGNPNAQPEKSRQWSAGVVFEPQSGTSISLDYWTIRRRASLQLVAEDDIFDTFAVADPVSAGGRFIRQPRLADGRCQGDTDIPTPANVPCAMLYFNDLIENLGKYNVSGVDLSVSARFPSEWGTFTFRLDGTYIVQYRFQFIADGPYEDNAGRAGANGAVSRWKHYAALDWRRGPWTATVAQNFVHGYLEEPGTTPSGDPFPERHVASYDTYDLQGTWDGWKGFKATLGVRNLFNRDPPASRQGNTFQVGYDARYYDPRGRTWYLALKYSFK